MRWPRSQQSMTSRQRRQVGLCSWLLALKVLANFPPGPSPFLGERGKRHLAHSGALPWQWGRGVIARAKQADLYAQGSWAEASSAFASPFLLGDELKQGLVSSSRRTMTSG